MSSPFGCVKSPFSTPVRSALLNWESKTAGDEAVDLLFAKIYFLIAGRLCGWYDLVKGSLNHAPEKGKQSKVENLR